MRSQRENLAFNPIKSAIKGGIDEFAGAVAKAVSKRI